MRNPISILPRRVRSRALDPWRALAEMENEMERWFEGAGLREDLAPYGFLPTCDLKETKKEFILTLDIPGVKKEDVKIEFENGRLSVSGERKEEKEVKDERRHLSEAYYGSFQRSFTLPGKIDENKVDAHYENGVLTVKIPRLETSKAKAIEIH